MCGVRVNLACVYTERRPVTVIRPLIPEPGFTGIRVPADIVQLVSYRAVKNLLSLGMANGVSLWEADWVHCPLELGHLPVGRVTAPAQRSKGPLGTFGRR